MWGFERWKGAKARRLSGDKKNIDVGAYEVALNAVEQEWARKLDICTSQLEECRQQLAEAATVEQREIGLTSLLRITEFFDRAAVDGPSPVIDASSVYQLCHRQL